MSLLFTVQGPFKVPTNARMVRGKRKYSINTASFWENEETDNFANCKGCYVFANASGTGFSPIYVGKTNKTFKKECFQAHKKTKLDEYLKDVGKSSLYVFFVVLQGAKKYLDEIDSFETLLIQKCQKVNPEILNERKLKEPFIIEGIYGDKKIGKPKSSISKFKKCLNIK